MPAAKVKPVTVSRMVEKHVVTRMLGDAAVVEAGLRSWTLTAVRDCVFRLMAEIAASLAATCGLKLHISALSEESCADILAVYMHCRLVIPDGCVGDVDGVVARYAFEGPHKGTYRMVRACDIRDAVCVLSPGATVKFIAGVTEHLGLVIGGHAAYQVVEDCDENLVFVGDGIYKRDSRELLPFDASWVRLSKLRWTWANIEAATECSHTLPDGSVYETPLDLFHSWAPYEGGVELLCQIALAALTGRSLGRLVTLYNVRGANGKSCYLSMLRALVGRELCLDSSVDDIAGGRFALAKLPGKKLLCCADSDGDEYIKKASRLKLLTTREPITVEAKGKDSFDYTPRALVIFAANNLILSRDKSGGWLRRQLIVPFTGVPDSPDPSIQDWVVSDGFQLWLIRYLLTEFPDFKSVIQPEECRRLLEDYALVNDTLKGFFATFQPVNALTSFDDAFSAYRAWLAEESPSAAHQTMSRTTFTKRVQSEICVDGGAYVCPMGGDNRPRQFRVAAWAPLADWRHDPGGCQQSEEWRAWTTSHPRGVIDAMTWSVCEASGLTPKDLLGLPNDRLDELFGGHKRPVWWPRNGGRPTGAQQLSVASPFDNGGGTVAHPFGVDPDRAD